jgi:hypothetical protein
MGVITCIMAHEGSKDRLAADTEVPGSISCATKYSEQQWVRNWVRLTTWKTNSVSGVGS